MKSSFFLNTLILALVFMLSGMPALALAAGPILAQDDYGGGYDGGYGAPQDYSQPTDTSSADSGATDLNTDYQYNYDSGAGSGLPDMSGGSAFSAPSTDFNFAPPSDAGSYGFQQDPGTPTYNAETDTSIDTTASYNNNPSGDYVYPYTDTNNYGPTGQYDQNTDMSLDMTAPYTNEQVPPPDTATYVPTYTPTENYYVENPETYQGGGYAANQGDAQDNSGVYSQNIGTYDYGNGATSDNGYNAGNAGGDYGLANPAPSDDNSGVYSQNTGGYEYGNTTAPASVPTTDTQYDGGYGAPQDYVPATPTNAGTTDANGNKFVPAPVNEIDTNNPHTTDNAQVVNEIDTNDSAHTDNNTPIAAVAQTVNQARADVGTGLGVLFGSQPLDTDGDARVNRTTAQVVNEIDTNDPTHTDNNGPAATDGAPATQTKIVTTVQSPSTDPDAYQKYLFSGNNGGCSEGGATAACVVATPYMPILQAQYEQIVQKAGAGANLPSFDSLNADQLAGLKDRIESTNGNVAALGTGIPTTKQITVVAAQSISTSGGGGSASTNEVAPNPATNGDSNVGQGGLNPVVEGVQKAVTTTKTILGCAFGNSCQQVPPENGTSQAAPYAGSNTNPYPESGTPGANESGTTATVKTTPGNYSQPEDGQPQTMNTPPSKQAPPPVVQPKDCFWGFQCTLGESIVSIFK